MHVKNILFVFLLLSLALACTKEVVPEPNQTAKQWSVALQPVFNGSYLFLDQTYTTPEGFKIQFTDIKMYCTDFKIGGSLMSNAALFDYRENGSKLFALNGDFTPSSTIDFNVGVPPSINHLDPSTFANSSALNIMNANDMHWGWNPGYIFLKIEAKVDTINDLNLNFDHFVVFHVGTDSFLQTKSLTGVNWIENSQNQFHLSLKVDMLDFLQHPIHPINIKTEYTSHSSSGQEALSLKVIQNFTDAIKN